MVGIVADESKIVEKMKEEKMKTILKMCPVIFPWGVFECLLLFNLWTKYVIFLILSYKYLTWDLSILKK